MSCAGIIQQGNERFEQRHESGVPRTLINRLEAEGVFDADATRILTTAFDAAWASLLTRDSPLLQASYPKAREIMAQHIIAMARLGERDREKLTKSALLELARANLK